jgi:type III secretory pathway component EscU
MFATDAGDYYPDKVFRVKMTVILLALIFAVIVKQNVPNWDRLPSISTGAKLVALVSLLLWVGAILAGVEIAAISGLG